MNGRKLKRTTQYLGAFLSAVGKAAARAAECEGRSQDYRVAYILRGFKPLLNALGNDRLQDRLAYLLAKFLKELSVLRTLDAPAARAEQLRAAFTQHAFFLKLHCKVETGLTSYARHYRVGSLIADDLCKIFEIQRLHIDLVGNGGVGHYRRGVGVAEHHLVALLLEGKARLSARIVELRRLTYHYRTRADDENFFDIRSLRHLRYLP